MVYHFSLTVAGHSASASSTSRPFHFSEHHPLVRTDIAEGVSWDKFTELGKVVDPYNLDDLFTKVKFSEPDRERISAEVQSSKNLGRGCHPIAWVKSLIDKSCNPQDLTYTANRRVDAFDEGLVIFQYSTDNRPDGVLLRSFRCDGKEWKLPLFILEEHSSPYKNSVSQTAVDVLEQLRLLRCFNRNIAECVGFTFPKYPTDSDSHKTCVTKVTVRFQNFQFAVSLAPLELKSVRKEIQNTVLTALAFQADKHPKFNFIRLSDDDIRTASSKLEVTVKQHSSRHSILLEGDSTFWKCIPSLKENNNIQALNSIALHSETTHITLSSRTILIGGQVFYKYPAQIAPLHKREVAQCLYEFMMQTATALEELHDLGFAHLDVRIPNICFAQIGGKYIVKLIDLDRCSQNCYKDLSGYSGEMYRPSTSSPWRPCRYDWKQLGLLAAELIFDTPHEEIVVDPRVKQDTCLKELILEGKCMVFKSKQNCLHGNPVSHTVYIALYPPPDFYVGKIDFEI